MICSGCWLSPCTCAPGRQASRKDNRFFLRGVGSRCGPTRHVSLSARDSQAKRSGGASRRKSQYSTAAVDASFRPAATRSAPFDTPPPRCIDRKNEESDVELPRVALSLPPGIGTESYIVRRRLRNRTSAVNARATRETVSGSGTTVRLPVASLKLNVVTPEVNDHTSPALLQVPA